MDPIAIVLCGLGAAFVSVGKNGNGDLLVLALVGGGLWGIHRVTRSRAPLWLTLGVALVWVLLRFWELAPFKTYSIQNEHATLRAAPRFVAMLVLYAIFGASVAIGRGRIGAGLAALALAALGVSLLANVAALLPDAGSSAAIVTEAAARGWSDAASKLVAMAWLAIGVGPVGALPLAKRGGAIVAAAGATLLCASFVGMPGAISGGHDGAAILCVGSMALAWLLAAIGLGGFARGGGGGAAWAGMGLVILQILALPFGVALGDSGQKLAAGVDVVLVFGFAGLGVAALGGPALPLRNARAVAAATLLAAAFGCTVAALAVFLDARGILHVQDPLLAVRTFTGPAGAVGTTLFAACLAYLAAPPSDAARGG